MGAFASKQFQDLLEDADQPPTPIINKRQLTQDPRSPSSDISRTPIHVEKILEPVNSMDDPRSPSVGIARTPLFVPTQSTQVDVIATPVRALTAELESLTDATPTKPKVKSGGDAMPNLTASCEKEPENESSVELLVRPRPSTETNSKQPTKTENGGKRHSLNSSNKKPTVLFHSKATKSPSVKSSQPGERSPLGVISDSSRRKDLNSPRAIVQRKQSSKIPMSAKLDHSFSSPVKYKIFSDDKENLSS